MFDRTWKSEAVQDILAHATQSVKADPDLTKGAGVQRYGWIDVAEKHQRPAKSKEKRSRGKGSDAEDKFDASAIMPAVNAFKESHPNFKVDVEEGRMITVRRAVLCCCFAVANSLRSCSRSRQWC